MTILELYFIYFVLGIIVIAKNEVPTEAMNYFYEVFNWTNFLIASAGYGICKRLDKIIKSRGE